MELVDTHAHLDDESFADDLPAVLSRAAAAGVTAVVAIGTDLTSCAQVVVLAEQYPQVWAVVGIHPHEAGAVSPEAVDGLVPWTEHPRVVALGETGLDYYRDFAPRPAQAALFRAHLQLAGRSGLPVVIHCRDAYADVLALLEEFPGVTCVFHAFSGSPQVARECVRRGHYLS
ncbi:MAG: TatD family hydrolase, partial [Armatimonadota bacterium]|nr:TatD family hydrolase [Armatimonadota bacterium]